MCVSFRLFDSSVSSALSTTTHGIPRVIQGSLRMGLLQGKISALAQYLVYQFESDDYQLDTSGLRYLLEKKAQLHCTAGICEHTCQDGCPRRRGCRAY
jgi:hypothetical protein